ncbi:trpS [Symbiodinium microadriaticum]|nr:trpS [Symbiodinium microadriaticum]
MVQFKEKAVKQGENVSMGLFDYPVLMAADILLYQSDLVPVGEDQLQHLELTREICRRFNDRYCKKKYPVFHEPAALIVDTGARVMSLQDGTCKMSKSAENDNSRINLLDPADVIKRKVKRCKTDAWTQLEWDNCDRPECMNLLRMYQAVTGLTTEQVISEVRTMSWSQFKPRLADSIIAHLEPIQVRYKDIVADEEKLVATLHDGKEKAQAVANTTLLQVKEAMGFYNI